MHVNADRFVDALLNHELPAPLAVEDARRAAELCVVHALLGQLAADESVRAERLTDAAFARIRDDSGAGASPELARIAWSRLWVAMAAGLLLVASIGIWYRATAAHRTVQSLAEVHRAQGPRLYALSVHRQSNEGPQTLAGTVGVDGHGAWALELVTQGDEHIVLGHGQRSYWRRTAAGEVFSGSDVAVLRSWLAPLEEDIAVPSIEETLARLERDYDIAIEIDPRDGTQFCHGRKVTADPAAADDVKIRFEPAQAGGPLRIRAIHWGWNGPGTDVGIGAVKHYIQSIDAELIDEQWTPPDGWFEPAAHTANALAARALASP